jgi:hypothetical protein
MEARTVSLVAEATVKYLELVSPDWSTAAAERREGFEIEFSRERIRHDHRAERHDRRAVRILHFDAAAKRGFVKADTDEEGLLVLAAGPCGVGAEMS